MADLPESVTSVVCPGTSGIAQGCVVLLPLGANPLGTPRVWPLALPPVRLPWERKS